MTQTLFIGLDGATFTVLDALTESQEGGPATMPFLRSLIDGGAKANLLSTANPLTPPAWVSLMTGRTPGNHGVYDFLKAEERGDQVFFTLSDARDVLVETIWSVASRHGKSVAALNFPITAPPEKVNGSIVPGFVPWRHLRRNVSPPELFDRLKEIPGFDPKELAWDFDREAQSMHELDSDGIEDWVRYHIDRERQWFAIAERLMTEDSPDLMAVMFDGTDKIQHQAWIYLDPAYAAFDTSEKGNRIRALCREYFANLDGYIERLVRLAGPDAQVFFASDHGFTASTEVVRINQVLHELGHLEWSKRGDSDQDRRRSQGWFADLNWSRTRAYCRTPSSNGINIRIADGSGSGGIEPADYEAFREQLIGELKQLKDAETGEPIISKIHRREEVFSGKAMRFAPDLLLVLRDYGFVSIAGQKPAVFPRDVPVGTHHPDGIFIASGKGIRQGITADRCQIIDVAATLLYSLGLRVPFDLEGVAAEELFEASHLTDHPVELGPPTADVSGGEELPAPMGKDEKQKILDQLHMLGYME
jgi:predicted AlkP superfamily phosphohydrolase/phosphomutase